MSQEPLKLRAARLEGGSCNEIGLDDAVRAVREPGSPVWVDVTVRDHDAGQELLQKKMGFHELAVEDALSDRERPALQEFDDLVFLVVPAPVRKDDEEERYVEIGYFLTEHALVTVSREEVPMVDAIYDQWKKRPGRLAHSTANLMHALIDRSVDGYFDLTDDVEDRVEDLADTLFEGHEGKLEEIVRLRRRLAKLRKIVSPVRDVMNSLIRRDLKAVPDESRRYFQDVMDHILRIAETVDTLRDALASMVDIHLSNVSNNLNQILKKMTVIATVLSSMTLVAGVYGMNFDHMPELKWLYGYPFSLALMALVGGGIVLVFKRVRWI